MKKTPIYSFYRRMLSTFIIVFLMMDIATVGARVNEGERGERREERRVERRVARGRGTTTPNPSTPSIADGGGSFVRPVELSDEAVRDRLSPAAACTEAQRMMGVLQQELGGLRLGTNKSDPTYQTLITRYNQEVQRFALFDGVKKVINNYRAFLSHSIQGPTTPTRLWGVGAIGKMITLESSIKGILDGDINSDRLRRFEGGRVCPNQDVVTENAPIATCRENEKISVLTRALGQQCHGNTPSTEIADSEPAAVSPAADSIAAKPLCRTLLLMRRERNREGRAQIDEMLGGFFNSYNGAYGFDQLASTETISVAASTQMRRDLNTLRDSLNNLSEISLVEESGDITLSGRELLTDQLTDFDRHKTNEENLIEYFHGCLDSPGTGGRAACAACYNTNATACLPETKPASLHYTDAQWTALRARPMRETIETEFQAMRSDITDDVGSSPLLRHALADYRTERVMGGPISVDDAIAAYDRRTTGHARAPDPANPNVVYDPTMSLMDHNDGLARLATGSSTDLVEPAGGRSLSSFYGTADQAAAFRAELKDQLIRGNNQYHLQQAAFGGRDLNSIKGNLFTETQFSDDKKLHYEMLKQILSLSTTEPVVTQTDMNCLKTGEGDARRMMNYDELAAIKGNAAELLSRFDNCIKEFNNGTMKEGKLSDRRRESQAELDRLKIQIDQMNAKPEFAQRQALLEKIGAIAQLACTGRGNRVTRMACDIADGFPVEEMEFFIGNNQRVLSSITRGRGNVSGDLTANLRDLVPLCTQVYGTNATAKSTLCGATIPNTTPVPLVAPRTEALVAEHGRLLREYHPDNDRRHGMSPSAEPRGAILAGGTAAAIGGGFGAIAMSVAGMYQMDANIAFMEQQAIQQKTFQVLSANFRFPPFPAGFSPVSPAFFPGAAFVVPPGAGISAASSSYYFGR